MFFALILKIDALALALIFKVYAIAIAFVFGCDFKSRFDLDFFGVFDLFTMEVETYAIAIEILF